MNILITGGLGYVGGRVARYLVERSEHNVFITTRSENLPDLDWLSSCTVIQFDITADYQEHISLFKQQGERVFDCVIHLASCNEIVCSQESMRAFEINSYGSLKLLQAAIETNVKRFIYFSTAHVYGAPLQGDLNEKMLTKPVHPYALTHKCVEDYVLAAHSNKHIEGVVLRLSNSFGSPVYLGVDRWSLILNDVAKQIIQNKSVVLRSDGSQERDFITLEDVARATLHFLELPVSHLKDGLFNLGGQCTMTILEIVKILLKEAQAIFGFYPQLSLGEPPKKSPNISSLNFSVDKLLSTQFQLKKNIVTELRELLIFCKEKLYEK